MIRHLPRTAPGLASCALFLLTCAAPAVETKTWSHSGRSDFEKGALSNLSLSSDGRLTLAPVFRELGDPSTAYLWALATDSKGVLYTGGGSPGTSTAKLTAIDPAGKTRLVAEIPGLQIQAIAIDKQDRVYVATAPDGKVYRVDRAGKFDVFYDPKAKYIWAIGFNSRGELFVATGDGGEVHKVTPDGNGSVFFRTEETHARSLAIDRKDNVVVGTEPGGLILRISPDGNGFVLHQASKREVTAVAVDPAGVIYAAAVGTKSGPPVPGRPTTVLSITTPPAPPAQMSAAGAGAGRPANAPGTLPPPPVLGQSLSGGSEVYRIGTDDYPQRIWSDTRDIVYAIGFDSSGRAVLGTGNEGNIHRIDSDQVSTLLIDAAPTQVTAFAGGPRGRLYAATGNVGKVFQIGPESEKSGSFESEPLDAEYFSYWGRVHHKADAGSGAIVVETRSGNLDRPQNNWSSWQAVNSFGRIVSPSARFLQYRVTLNGTPTGPGPELRAIHVAYMGKNVAPLLEEIEITPANYRFPEPTLPTSSANNLTLPPLGGTKRTNGPAIKLDGISSSQTMSYSKGSVGARWAANDPNDDGLLYKLEIRGVREKEWKLLKDKVSQKHYSWDSTTLPDGEYILRVTASDSPDNPPDKALTAQLESDRFVIDNTAPRIAGLTGAKSGAKVTARWKATDDRSVISKAEYSLSGGDWIVVQPTTGLSDALELQYELSVDTAGPAAEITIAVRVTDEFDNQSVEKVVIR